jgi:mannose-6-phosphate isomerase-like protein (cupin superfamily)
MEAQRERRKGEAPAMIPSAVIDIVAEARRNNYYRRVVYTGELSQLVVMALRPNEEIGREIHREVEQSIFIVEGSGRFVAYGRQRIVRPGDAIVITPGTRHNLIAESGPLSLRLFTIYTPPNHIDGRIHRTRADAEADVEDREFGETVGYR